MKKIYLIISLSMFLLTACPESNIVDYSEIGWNPIEFPNTELQISSVYFKDTLTGWITAALFKPYDQSDNYASIYYTNDGGKSWQEQLKIDTNYFYEIDFWNENHAYALAQDGFLFESKDGGQNWKQKPLPTNNSLRDIFFQDENTAWIVGVYGTILKTTDQGENWNLVKIDSGTHYFGIHFFNENDGILIGGEDYVGNTDARVQITRDGGKTWSTSLFVEGAFCRDADYNGDVVIVAGTEGLLVKSTDRGATWKTIDLKIPYPLNAVAWADENKVWICGYYGQVYFSEDKGDNWQKYDTGNNVNYYDIKFIDSLHGWLVGHFGSIYYTRNGGKDVVLQ